MRKSVLVLLAVLSVSMAALPEPWEDNRWVAANPNIWSYGVEIWWNHPGLHKTLDSLSLERSDDFSVEGNASDLLKQAVDYKKKADQDRGRCYTTILANMGSFPTLPTLFFLNVFSESAPCMSYKTDWTGTVGSASSALEYSDETAGDAVMAARVEYDALSFSGICGGNYTGPGSEKCPEFMDAFHSLDNGITEGRYGKYALFKAYLGNYSKALMQSEPDLSAFPVMVALVWGGSGIIPTFSELKDSAEASFDRAESEYSSRIADAGANKKLLDEAIRSLDGEDLYLISEAPSSSEVRTPGSVKERLGVLKKKAGAADLAFAEAKSLHGSTIAQGYLAASLSRAADAAGGYAILAGEASALLDDAEDTVETQRGEAEDELAAAGEGGFGTSDVYRDAVRAFEDGERASTLGKRFFYYSKAAALARSASAQPGPKERLSHAAGVAGLQDLIGRAEKDQINVVSEKEILGMISILGPYEAEKAVSESSASIISKARAKYEDALLNSRKRVAEKLSLAGPEAADLLTDLERMEEGLVVEGELSFPDAIGSLRRLGSGYLSLEETVDSYMKEIVGNAMSVSSDPLVGDVVLDQPVEIALDAVFTNPTAYNATHVAAAIHMDRPAGFLFSDITQGKEEVESVRISDGGKTVVVVFSEAGPFETKRVVFSRKEILARTVEKESEAIGIGNGEAVVKEKIIFELDTAASLAAVPGEATIDGLPPDRILAPGRHTMLSERLVRNAYEEEISDFKAYRVGVSSRMEYDVAITPEMDLDRVQLILDSLNDSNVLSFEVTSPTGDVVKNKSRISGTQYYAQVHGLKEGRKAVVRVAYAVEDTESFVKERIGVLDSSNLTEGGKALLEEAKSQSASGNHTNALELIERALAASKQEEKELSKMGQEHALLDAAVRGELAEIESSLPSASNGSFTEKLKARKSELERVLSEAAGFNLSGKIAALDKVDKKWLEKELTAARKDAYSEYNALKERFYLAGNSSTPGEFLLFEEALGKLESGKRLEYALDALSALDLVASVVERQEEKAAESQENMRKEFEKSSGETLDAIDRYMRQASAAKGTEYSSLFTESEKKIHASLDDAEEAIGSDPRIFWEKMKELEGARERMELVLANLKSEAEAKIAFLENDDAHRKELAPKLESLRRSFSSGDYVNVLRSAGALMKETDSVEEDESGLLVLGITGLALLAGAGFYIYKQPKPKKEFRKLPSWGDLDRTGKTENKEKPAG
ncbi:MAG: hypothetical protein AB1324_07780 [Candidatus Micrarchaeota archaeon]